MFSESGNRSGLKLQFPKVLSFNFQKQGVFDMGCNSRTIQALSFPEGSLPAKHLGLPLFCSILKIDNFRAFIQKIKGLKSGNKEGYLQQVD